MFASSKGIPYRSRPIDYATGATTNVDLSFLYEPVAAMPAPVVREIALQFRGSISGTTGGFVGDDACQIFANVQIRDAGGLIHDLPGKLMRARELIELGQRGQDDTDGIGTAGDVASGATNASYEFILRIPFDLEQAHVGADTALPVPHLVSGGQILVSMGTPANAVVNSGNITCYAIVHDERTRELKSRLIVKSFAMNRIEDDYVLNGSTRIFALLSSIAGSGYTDWPTATFPTIDVQELQYSTLSTDFLRSEYSRVRMDRATDDPLITGGPDGIPIIWPSRGQRIDKLPDLQSLRVRLPAAPVTGAQVLMSYIEDRYPALAATWLGFDSIDGFLNAIGTRGMLKLGGGLHAVTDVAPKIARRLPMVLTV